MREHSSAIDVCSPVLSPGLSPVRSAPRLRGIALGALGVLAFSFTIPLTRLAVHGMSPLFIANGRAVVAAILAALMLAVTRPARPRGVQWARLAVVAGGIVLGFPLLTSLALQTAPASHGTIVIALLPAATAIAATLRAKERQGARFWAFNGLGAAAALAFGALQGGRFEVPTAADALLIAAVIAAAVGYAEGALLARELGAWQTISWALLVAAPATLALTWVSLGEGVPHGGAIEWLAFGYLGVVSMYVGFFAWYGGLALGPIASVSQVQLVQPMLSLAWAGLLLGEHLGPAVWIGGAIVIACAAGAVRARR
ncbi:DMT family transporter [Micrococcales bacterium 31B]|nr:DMT family transporter [Micrococcales bacterium 31B]